MTLATRAKTPAYHKKRVGKHRPHNKQYLKSYWPYIPLLGIVGLGLFVNGLLTGPHGVLGDTSDFSQTALVAETNLERSSSKELPLVSNNVLAAAAQAKANDMVARNYWSHDTPDGKTPWAFLSNAGYQYQTAGENLAYGFNNASDVIKAWMSSSEHRANLLSAKFQQVGFGVASSPNYQDKGPEIVVVALYASPANVEPALLGTKTLGAGATTSAPALKPVSRLQLVADGTVFGSASLLSFITTAMVVAFLVRHARAWRRALVKSEAFVLHHAWLDIAIVLVATAGAILTRVVGKIG
ncbi:MAG TPA: CAP domain-containing protein [Candidatus Saccharimonadales bacterium]|nr:CAP domain-containing protein [Candidatus Saccharimonadales bacterium]